MNIEKTEIAKMVSHFKRDIDKFKKFNLLMDMPNNLMFIDASPVSNLSVRKLRTHHNDFEYTAFFGIYEKNGFKVVAKDDSELVNKIINGEVYPFEDDESDVVGYTEDVRTMNAMIEYCTEYFSISFKFNDDFIVMGIIKDEEENQFLIYRRHANTTCFEINKILSNEDFILAKVKQLKEMEKDRARNAMVSLFKLTKENNVE